MYQYDPVADTFKPTTKLEPEYPKEISVPQFRDLSKILVAGIPRQT